MPRAHITCLDPFKSGLPDQRGSRRRASRKKVPVVPGPSRLLQGSVSLERHARVQLDDAPRQRHAQERAIGVGRRRNAVDDRAEAAARNVVQRQVEVRVIEQVEEVGSNRELQSLRNIDVLRHIHIRVEETWPMKRIAGNVAEVQLTVSVNKVPSRRTRRVRSAAVSLARLEARMDSLSPFL